MVVPCFICAFVFYATNGFRGSQKPLTTYTVKAQRGAMEHHGRVAKRTYHSSEWERMWVENVHAWTTEYAICSKMAQQREYIQRFVEATCSARSSHSSEWCLLDDSVQRIEWNTRAFCTFYPLSLLVGHSCSPDQLDRTRMPTEYDTPQPVILESESLKDVFSWFDVQYEDGFVATEFIEPLVSHLRHPMMCEGPWNWLFHLRSEAN